MSTRPTVSTVYFRARKPIGRVHVHCEEQVLTVGPKSGDFKKLRRTVRKNLRARMANLPAVVDQSVTPPPSWTLIAIRGSFGDGRHAILAVPELVSASRVEVEYAR